MGNKSKIDSWIGIIEKWKKSGLSQRQFCFKNGISKNTFYYYHKKIKQKKQKFVEVSPIEFTPQTIEIQIISGNISMKIPETFCERTLVRLLKVFGVQTHVN